MVIGNQDTGGGANNGSHPSGIPQDQIDNIMSGIANTGDVKMNNHRKKLRQRFDIIKKLGQGTYGKVQLGINKETGQEVAIKTIKKCKIEAEADLVRIRREVQIMSSVQHPNIIHIYEVFENREKMVLVMEFAAGGELYDYLSERKVLSEEEARRIFRQVATAVYYCHKHKICHRDLKLENILLDENGNAKIADFGLSNVFNEQCLLATFCGSPLYASPEIVEGTPYHGPEVDCWSLGVLLYTLVYGSMPFDGSNFKRLVKQISQGDYYEPKKPSRASSLIREMLTVCPRKRATIEQICSHWWVNENDNLSCLELAEDLANQTPVRLDVLLSLTPVAVTADQLVVTSADCGNSVGKSATLPRSHSVGSIRDVVPNTEAERRILDMVAAGGEAALMPSPTRTITPAQSPLQTKRKLENTISTDNAASVALKKKDKPEESISLLENETAQQTVIESTLLEESLPMETDELLIQEEGRPSVKTNESVNFSVKDMEVVGGLCEQLIQDESNVEKKDQVEKAMEAKKTAVGKFDVEEAPEKTKGATKVIKKFVSKHKTADLVNVIGQIDPENTKCLKNETIPERNTSASTSGVQQFVRKCSLQDESPLNKFNTERRKSRILETAEKFQQMNTAYTNTVDKNKKLYIPGVSVGNFKKEYERRATTGVSNQEQQPTADEHRMSDQETVATVPASSTGEENVTNFDEENAESSNSKVTAFPFSLEEARRSMENSIALLRQAQTESSKDVNQLCAKTENIRVSDTHKVTTPTEREKKLMNARAIIGNAIQPVSQAAGETPSTGTMKTSTASITLKSATLPRRKTAKTEIQLDIKPPIIEQPSMRFTTEMQHPVADLRSAPPREGPVPFSPVKSIINPRASSLEPKEHVIPIQKPPSNYARTFSNTSARSNSLSRQSTNDSESDNTTANMSQATITGSSQPIKKSPREFIIPIAVEGGGFITPREGSIEPSESSHTTGTTSSRSTFTRLRPTRRIGSLLSESGVDDKTPFQKLRTSSTNRDGEDDTRFTLHKLRSSRPVKKISQDNDSQSSGEEDDDDGFEILTAENLFSTLLQRVRALTNRMNVNNDISTAFPSSSRLLTNMRQAQSPFWNQEPFGSRLNNAAVNAPWRHSMSRDLGSDMESMFSRTGATLPRGKCPPELIKDKVYKTLIDNTVDEGTEGPLDLADLDLSRLRLSKKDLETLSNIAPGLPKCFQDQLLAKLPPTQARKLSRTLSVQTNQNCSSVTINKRSQSSGRNTSTSNDIAYDRDEKETPSCSITTISEKSSEFKKEIETFSDPAQHMTCTKINDDENAKGSAIIQNTNVNEKYKYYSPYVIKTIREMSQRNNINEGLTDLAPVGGVTMLGRPPSGRLSPPSSTDSAIRRPTQRRISRLIRPELLETSQEETVEEPSKSLNPTDNATTIVDSYRPTLKTSRHVRNKSLELFAECTANNSKKDDSLKNSRRSLSRSRDVNDKVNADKHQLADKILQELQILSSMQSQRGVCQELNDKPNILKEKSTLTTAKKVKKTKSKEKSTESSTDMDSKNTNNVIKKVKKIVKKSDPPISLKVQENQRELCETNNSVSVSEATSPKKMSKLKRPKSYPMKESASITPVTEMCNTTLTSATNISSPNDDESNEHRSNESNVGMPEFNSNSSVVPRESRLLRPKSYPISKLTVQTELKKNDRNMSNTTHTVGGESALINSTKKVSKGLKKSKLSQLSNTSASIPTPNSISTNGENIKELSPISHNIKTKEKAVEKKTNKGLLYAIGQKFEKLRASATSSSCANIPIQKQSLADNTKTEKVINKTSEVKKTKSLGCNSYPTPNTSDKINNCKENKIETTCIASKPLKSEKRSRIDAMIRNLRERSVPRSQPSIPSESNYIKRAVSVEEMPGTFNKKSVNKMLGLFKRADKSSTSENRVRTTRSTSNIERHVSDTSPIYQNTDIILKVDNNFKKNNAEACMDELVSSNKPVKTCKNEGYCKCDTLLPTVSVEHPTFANPNCPECCIELSEETKDLSISNIKNYKEGNQEKRKGLMLELLRIEKGQNASSIYGNICSGKKYPSYNDNELYSNVSQYSRSIPSSSGNGSNILTMENSSNNNISSMINSNTNGNNNNSNNNHSSSLHTSQTSGYRTSSTHEINQNNNLLSPSFENIGNYSSDSRSYQEDCASTSTFLSPTEEAELCFDAWSVCSEDNYRRQHATPSPTVSRLSRTSQASSPTRRGGDSSETSESVVDRIKRRSFYCRFNEKRPKRTSSIVGPNAVREYYRDKSSTTKTRSSTKIATTEREHSPDITQEFFRPLKLSPIGTELKPPIYRSSFSTTHTDYSSAAGRPRKSLSDIRAPPSPSCLSERRHGSFINPDKDLLTNSPIFPSRYKINAYEDVSRSKFAASDTYYNTYNPKRRFSFTTNANACNTNGGISNTNSSHIDGYATMGRRPIRTYDHRTMSLLDPPNYSTPTYRHEAATATATPSTVRDLTTSLSRSNSRYRKSSTSRSPNNI